MSSSQNLDASAILIKILSSISFAWSITISIWSYTLCLRLRPYCRYYYCLLVNSWIYAWIAYLHAKLITTLILTCKGTPKATCPFHFQHSILNVLMWGNISITSSKFSFKSFLKDLSVLWRMSMHYSLCPE